MTTPMLVVVDGGVVVPGSQGVMAVESITNLNGAFLLNNVCIGVIIG